MTKPFDKSSRLKAALLLIFLQAMFTLSAHASHALQETAPKILIISDGETATTECQEALATASSTQQSPVVTLRKIPSTLRLKSGEAYLQAVDSILTTEPDSRIIVLCVGARDKADTESGPDAYSRTLFDFPTGHIRNRADKNERLKRLAVSKEEVQNKDFAGAIYNLTLLVRRHCPQGRLFVLPPSETASPTPAVPRQIKEACHLMCVPTLSKLTDIQAYSFLWSDDKPQLGSVLLLGDSYCEQRRWTAQLERIASVKLENIGVGSMTIRDKKDWRKFAYTPTPTKAYCSDNRNTLACQVERLKTLTARETAADDSCHISKGYAPDIVLIEGGANDMPDAAGSTAQYTRDIEADDRTSFAGALAHAVASVRALFPNARICIVTPCGLYYGHTDRPFDFILKARQMRTAASILGVETIDWDAEGRLSFVFNNSAGTGAGTAESPYRYDIETAETRDLLHPNDTGGLYLAEAVVKALLTPAGCR